MARKSIPVDAETEVLILCRRRCCICFGLNRDDGIKRGQIAHLDHDRTNHALGNLAFLCLDHHDEYDSRTSQTKKLTAREVKTFRSELHSMIESAWRPKTLESEINAMHLSLICGRYVKQTKNEESEIEIAPLPDGRVQVTGVSLWGTNRKSGPNIGELDFEAPLIANSIEFLDLGTADYRYNVRMVFHNGGLTVKEERVGGYFGMNVSFEGEYQKVRDLPEANSKYQRSLERVIADIAEEAKVRVQDVGLHVWMERSVGPRRTDVALERVARLRLSDCTPSKPRQWRKGEGVVGICWERQTDFALDLSNPRLALASEDDWGTLGRDLTVGLTFAEFQSTSSFFAAICASPIVPDQSSVGCVSLNFDRECDSPFNVLWSRKVKELLRRAAADIASTLR